MADAAASRLPNGLRRSTLTSAEYTITRLTQADARHAEFARADARDGYVLMLKLQPPHSFDLFVDGVRQAHARQQAPAAGSLCMVHLQASIRLVVDAPFDMVRFSFPHRALETAAAELGLPLPGALQLPTPGTCDPAVTALGQALLPSLDRPAQASALFVSHATLALGAHLLHTYGGRGAPAPRGGLAPWQERRAKEMLRAHLRGDVRIADIAAECGLSAGYFATAFRRSAGQTPSAWLLSQRIEQARTLLRDRALTLPQVAAATGFADQSHFTRTFTRLVGTPPGAWRRLQ